MLTGFIIKHRLKLFFQYIALISKFGSQMALLGFIFPRSLSLPEQVTLWSKIILAERVQDLDLNPQPPDYKPGVLSIRLLCHARLKLFFNASLQACFKDDSWPVRDMACVASGSFVKSFPEASSGSLPVLLDHFFENLQDPISSVRQGAAASLANTVKAYGKDAVW